MQMKRISILNWKEKKIIERIGYGAFVSRICDFCNRGIQSNNYCTKQIPTGKYALVDEPHIAICGKAMCVLCRESWGSAEKFCNRCIDHCDESTTHCDIVNNNNCKGKFTFIFEHFIITNTNLSYYLP